MDPGGRKRRSSGARPGCRRNAHRLGGGQATAAFVLHLANRVRSGLRFVAVPTSEDNAAEARSVGVLLGALDDDGELALTVDGTDEVSPSLDLVKGFGGALIRQRIVGAASHRQVILVGHDKLSTGSGCAAAFRSSSCRSPARRSCAGSAARSRASLRIDCDRPMITDNGNLTVDHALAALLSDTRAARTPADLPAIPGVVDTGLLSTAERVLAGYSDGHVAVLQAERGR